MTIRIVCFQVSSIVGPFVEVGEALASPVVSSFGHFHPMLDFYPCEYRLLALAFYSDLDGPPFSVSLEAVVECFVLHCRFPLGCEGGDHRRPLVWIRTTSFRLS